ncbi:hypothetical protein HDC94_002091 [Leifsonia sp. AK011]|uniref:hypothetical protein n=1 Tax=Leifsonia sp. AK011 TaxID=2723075 RepID=UPI0015C8E138|nr:hypothetical protein [Leifsonia sp. AK011]NYF10935.1 hypothetical protein [Leifsonia sp. AK011]
MTPRDHDTHPPVRRPLARRLVALVLAVAIAAVTLPLFSERPAAAATTGAGYSGITPYGGYLGNYIAPDGMRVYCMDSARDWPSGVTDTGTIVSSVDTQWGEWLSETVVRKLNYAMLTWGQTEDPTTAAAVSAYVYAYTSTVARTQGAGYAAGAHYINGNAAVMAAYDTVWTVTESTFAGSASPKASVTVALDGWDGSVRVTVEPSSAQGTLSLQGAVVAGTRDSQISVTNGSLVPVRAVVPDGEATASVAASVSFTVKDGAGASLVVYNTGSQQRTLRGAYHEERTTSASDRASSNVTFSPIAQTTVASRYVETGQPFVDGVSVSLTENSPEWRTLDNGSKMPVEAVGTLYGPFSQQPAVADVPPEGVPVVGTERLTLTGTGDYASPGTLIAPSPGFYTWVWRIEAADQPTIIARMLPEGYSFSDQFGLIAESHVVPMGLDAVSQVSTSETGLGGEISDQLSVTLTSGSWLTEAGVPIPARFEGTAYFVPGTDPLPESETVPASAEVIGTAEIVARAAGIYPASTSVIAPNRVGHVTWVWRLDPASASAPYFEPWTDRFGMPAETTRVSPPSVATVAMPASVVGDEVRDSALVGGFLPAEPSTLVFRAYLQPARGDEPVCDETTLAFDSSDRPVPVTSAGTYESSATRFTEYGTYYWVESLYSSDGELIHEGVCGLPEETTLVSPADVSTQAAHGVQPGERAFDTAQVTGDTPAGMTLVFRAYAQHGIEDGPLCDDSTLVFTSDEVAVHGQGTYRSEATTFDRPGTYFWVETLYDKHGNPLHVGRCGIRSETTEVQLGSLALTGLPLWPAAGLAGGMLGAGVVALLVALLAARRASRLR